MSSVISGDCLVRGKEHAATFGMPMFVNWMKTLPGAENGLTYRGQAIKNWWSFIGDFDNAVKSELNLTAAVSSK